MEEQNVSGFPVTLDGSGNGEVVGRLTRRDMKFVDSSDQLVGELMTSENLVKGGVDTTLEEAEARMTRARVEKLILVDESNNLCGLVTMRDIENIRHHPKACRDNRGRLRVGAAVGVHQYDRVEALINAEVDVVTVDTAHGHSQNVIDTVKEIKNRWDIDVIAGNIATTEGAQALIEAGVDAVKANLFCIEVEGSKRTVVWVARVRWVRVLLTDTVKRIHRNTCQKASKGVFRTVENLGILSTKWLADCVQQWGIAER
jgi:IMP dehydrogenase